jgi:outer membrane protein
MQRVTVTLVAVILAAATAAAQRPPADTLEWSLGFGVISSPRPYVGASNSTFPVPLVQLRSGRLSIDGIRASYRLVGDSSFHLDLVGGPNFTSLEESDSDFLRGMADRDWTFELGLAAAYDRRRWGILAWARQDVLDRSGGQRAGIDVALRRTYLEGKLFLFPGVGLEWQSRDVVDYYYGVRPEEALPERPEYRPGSALNLSATLLARYRLTKRLDLVSIARGELLDDEVTASPIVDRDWSWFGLVGLSWRMR